MSIRRINKMEMSREEFEKVVDYYDKEGYMHPNDIDKLIELAAKGLSRYNGDSCQEETQ